jgi:hypothetical protein
MKFGPQLPLDLNSVSTPASIPADLAFRISKIQEAQLMIVRKWRELQNEAHKAGYTFPDSIDVVLFNIEMNSDFLQLILRAETIARRINHSNPTAAAETNFQDGRETPHLGLVGSIPRSDSKT